MPGTGGNIEGRKRFLPFSFPGDGIAQNIRLRHAQSGVITTGFYGFSWTTLFFSGFPAIFRGDLITGVIVLILSASSFWLVAIIWAFLYNRVYTTRLLERGYVFDDDPEKVREAKRALRIQE